MINDPISRRVLVAGLGAGAVLALAAASGLSLAQDDKPPAEVPVDELMRPGALPDRVLGSPDAKVTIVEYASMTCGHCARFHAAVFPGLNESYIYTGKVRFILREFPLDGLAAAAFMLVRCNGDERAHASIGELFATQEAWAFGEGDPLPKLFAYFEKTGMTKERFDACVADKELLEKIKTDTKRAAEVFGVNATPTFFVNGKRFTATPTLEEFHKVLEPLLAKS